MNKDKVLITGGAGYLGSVTAEHLLNQGYEVTCLDNFSIGEDSRRSLLHLAYNPKFDFVFGDVRDKRTLETLIPKFDTIIPLAAIVGFPQCKQNPIDSVLTNRDAVINTNNIRTAGQKLIYPTTNSGYGTTTGEIQCTEETSLNPISLYGETKVAAEKAILESDKPAITLRLATLFGMSPRMRTDLLVNYFVLKAVTDGNLVVYEKNFMRNFAPVRDVARVFEHCIENYEQMGKMAYDDEPMRNRPYNVGLDSANLSKQGLCEEIQKQLPGFTVDYKEISKDPDKRNYIVSNERLNKTGFVFEQTLPQGITELIKGYKVMFGGTVFRQ